MISTKIVNSYLGYAQKKESCAKFSGRAAGLYTLVKPELTGSIPGLFHKFRIVRIIISDCLVKQPNGTTTLSRISIYSGLNE